MQTKQVQIAQVGNLWVWNMSKYFGEVRLTSDKARAGHLNKEDIEWLKSKVDINVTDVSVTIIEQPAG